MTESIRLTDDESETAPARWDDPGHSDVSKTRSQVLSFITNSPEPLDAAQIASRMRLHVTTVRFHLGHLEQAGLVRRESVNEQRRGRPRVAYRAAPVLRAHTSQRQLITVLARALSREEDGRERAIEAGRAWADELAVESDTDGVARAALTSRLDLLGFDPVDDGDNIQLLACPFRDAAAEHPAVVCSVHLGLIQRTVELGGGDPDSARLFPFVEPQLCTVALA